MPLYARSPFLDSEAIRPEEAKAFIVGSASEDKRKLVEEFNFNSIGYAEKVSYQKAHIIKKIIQSLGIKHILKHNT